jgi:hypothetical protein
MPSINNFFTAGIMNKDLDERLVPSGTYRDALNITVENSTGANSGAVHNSLGNNLISNLSDVIDDYDPLTSNARTIGAVVYEQDHLIYWLVSADNFDAILEYNGVIGVTTAVLVSTTGQLNFSKEYIVTGINYVNGFLYWTDNFNPPRKINISRSKTYAVDDTRIDDDLSVIIEPPLNAPSIRLFNTPNTSNNDDHNNIEEKFIYFAYRWKYIDNQYSAVSPFSAVAFNPKDFVLDFNIGNTKTMVNRYNSAEIQVKTGGRNVKEIQVIMYDTNGLNCNVIETFDKFDLSISDNSFYRFIFNNNKTYSILEQAQVTRLFDNVPLLAKSQDFVGNRIMYGNYTQFYDIEFPVAINVAFGSTDNNGVVPIQTFRSDRDYEIGVIYLDEYGRHTTVLTSLNNTTYIPPTQSDKGNSLDVTLFNTPPIWATNYRLVIKQSQGEYYNILPMYFYTSGQFRYFLIHESDKDKFAVGDYLIFKCDAAGPTYSNKKYKILEFKDQLAGFAGISGALPGLYIKIKVDFPSELNPGSGQTTYWMGSFGNSESTPILIANGTNLNGYAEDPIYYGEADPNSLSLDTNSIFFPSLYNGDNDFRITVEVISSTEFRWTKDITSSGGWTNANIDLVNSYFINTSNLNNNNAINAGEGVGIRWSTQPVLGDIWKINLRGIAFSPTGGNIANNYFGGSGNNDTTCPLTLDPNQDITIYPGDIIEIRFQEDQNPYSSSATQVFYSNGTYENIEEWFVESETYLIFQNTNSSGINEGSNSVWFRRGSNFLTIQSPIPYSRILYDKTDPNFKTYPVYMLIKGSSIYNPVNRMAASITVKHLENAIIAETVGKESDIDIYHELSETYKIANGRHEVLWRSNDFTAPTYAGIYTNLGQEIPGSAITVNDQQHNFHVGEQIYIHSSNTSLLPNGYYTILQVPNPYNIVIDLVFPGSGPVTPAGISYYEFDQNQTGNNLTNGAKIRINNTKVINSDYNAWSYTNGMESYRIRDDFNRATIKYSQRVSTTVDEYKQKKSENAISYSGVYGENTGINKLNEFNLSLGNFKYLDKEFGSIQKMHARDTDLVVFQENKVSLVRYGKNLLYDAVGGSQVASIQEVLGTQVSYPGEYGISKNPESFSVWGDNLYFTDSRRGAVLSMQGDQIIDISNIGMRRYFKDLMSEYSDTQKLGGYDPRNNMYILSSNENSVIPCDLTIDNDSIKLPSNASGNIYNLFNIISSVGWEIELIDIGFGTNWCTLSITQGIGNQLITATFSNNTTDFNRSVKVRVYFCDEFVDFTINQAKGKRIRVKPIVLVNQPIGSNKVV